MRRRSLLISGVVFGLAGCTPRPEPTSFPSASDVAVETDDFALIFSNLAAGEDPEQRQGVVILLDAEGGMKAKVEFTPMDNARLITHNGAVAWLATDAAHHWHTTHRAWGAMPSHGGAVGTLLPAEDNVLAIINEGTQDPETYQSGLLLFNNSEALPWKHAGVLGSSVGWSQGQVFGFSKANILTSEVQLTSLNRDTEVVTFGPVIDDSSVWGDRLVNVGDHTYALVAEGTSGAVAQLWQIDPDAQTVTPIPLDGPGAEVSDWYIDGGPASLTAIGDEVYWLDSAGVWAAAPESGSTRLVKGLSGEPQASWFLSTTGLIRVSGAEGRWDLEVFSAVDGKPSERVREIHVDGPRDLYPFGAVRVG